MLLEIISAVIANFTAVGRALVTYFRSIGTVSTAARMIGFAARIANGVRAGRIPTLVQIFILSRLPLHKFAEDGLGFCIAVGGRHVKPGDPGIKRAIECLESLPAPDARTERGAAHADDRSGVIKIGNSNSLHAPYPI